MKRAATWLIYIVGAASVAYLALFAYATWRGAPLEPGDPIKIFRKDDAPNYSSFSFPLPQGEKALRLSS